MEKKSIQSSDTQRPLPFVLLGAAVVIGVVVVGCVAYRVVAIQNQINSLRTTSIQSDQVAKAPERDCSSSVVPGYEVAMMLDQTGSHLIPAHLSAHLKGDESTQTVILYDEQVSSQGGARSKPVITKVFSGASNCLQEEFSYTGEDTAHPNNTFFDNLQDINSRQGNELHKVAAYPNFWGDARTVVDIENEATGYGSAATYYLNFLSYQKGKYQVTYGPAVGSDDYYAFLGTKGIGTEILVARPIWAATEAHTDPHRYTFEKYIWNGTEYDHTQLGTTHNKYDSQLVTLEQILQKEPGVLK